VPLVFLVGSAGVKEYWSLRVKLPQGLTELSAGRTSKPIIQQIKIEVLGLSQVQRFRRACRSNYFTVMTVEYYDDKVTSVRIILSTEDPKLGGWHVIQPFGVWTLERTKR
jgi:hypothetical protein